jgi:hypothetical protein
MHETHALTCGVQCDDGCCEVCADCTRVCNAAASCRYPSRLYAGLGVDLWMLKLKGALAALGTQPGTYASGRVSCCSVVQAVMAIRLSARN